MHLFSIHAHWLRYNVVTTSSSSWNYFDVRLALLLRCANRQLQRVCTHFMIWNTKHYYKIYFQMTRIHLGFQRSHWIRLHRDIMKMTSPEQRHQEGPVTEINHPTTRGLARTRDPARIQDLLRWAPLGHVRHQNPHRPRRHLDDNLVINVYF